ncbi:uncharacterized protein LOC132178400 [Corylus avellana]|uniref:uncharacterized protein LOC132178400 n=1 Tax=Corylus avellana TaxID=13451 RepID=UPI00286B5975|nr:uncharacterized protein LOC132178400 [Corylus avellana]
MEIMEWRKCYMDVVLVPLGIFIFWQDIEKRNIVAVQTLRNTIMGSTLMATTSIILCAGLAEVISSTYGVTKTPFDDTVYGGQGEFMVAVKRATLLITFLLSFFSHSMSLTFLNQVNILISTLEDPKSIVTPEYVSHLLEKGCGLSTAGNRIFYLAIPLLLWFFGPLLAFLCFLTMVPLLYNHDFLYQRV